MTRGFCSSRFLLPALAWTALVVQGPPASAQIRVSPNVILVQQGTAKTLTAERQDHLHAEWLWTLEKGPAGGVINPDTGRYHAPMGVTKFAQFVVRVTDKAHPEVTKLVKGTVLPGPIAIAPGDFLSAVLQGGTEVEAKALRADGEAANWFWQVDERSGAKLVQRQGRTFIQAPRVTGPGTIDLKVTDLAHPGEVCTTSIKVVPRLVNIRAVAQEAQPLRSGHRLDVMATRADSLLGASCTWSVLEPNGGTLAPRTNGTVRYTAPRVALRTTFHLRATSTQDSSLSATLPVEVRPTIEVSRPQLPLARRTATIAPTRNDDPHLVSGNTCVLKARTLRPRAAAASNPGEPPPIRWQWQVVAGNPGAPISFTPGPGRDEVSFQAPEVATPSTFTLQVQDPEDLLDPAQIKVHVLPALPGLQGVDSVFEQIMPALMGSDWLAPVPVASLLAGRLGTPDARQPSLFKAIHCITFVEADPELGWLSGKWLVGDDAGIKAVSAQGEVTPLPGVHGPVTAIAIRPRGSAPGNPDRVAYATRDNGDKVSGVVHLLKNNVTPTALAGTHGQLPAFATLEGSHGPRVDFGDIIALNWARDGRLLVVDKREKGQRLRRIAPDGQVSLVASNFEWGTGTFDPDTGAAYFPGPHNLIKYTLDGSRSFLDIRAFPRVLASSSAPIPTHFPSEPLVGRIQSHGDHLFTADPVSQALSVLNLRTGTRVTLVGDRSATATRMGPLAFGSPALAPHACAALVKPLVFHVNSAGDCLVAQDRALVQLDLGAYAVEPAEPMEDIAPQEAGDEAYDVLKGGHATAAGPAEDASRSSA